MNLEKYHISIKPEQVLFKIIEERKREAYRNISLVERIIKEKLANKTNDIKLELWLGIRLNLQKSLSNL